MTRKKKENEFVVDENMEVAKDDTASIVVETPVAAVVKPKAPLVVPMMTFDRYFISLGKPLHHKHGMAAYIGKLSKSKKTREAWDKMFKGY